MLLLFAAYDAARPAFAETGTPRADRFVGVFYFLWLGAHVNGGPYDITKILARDPGAMQKKDSTLWGPLHAPHHWGESLFGYYLTDDAYVLRKHAQMLSDAGVDTLIFDVTNNFTYKQYYMALLRVFSEVRQNGGKTPQVVFLCPFGNPSKVVEELFRDLYQPGLYPDLWFRWEGKPLILADPAMIRQSERIREFFTFRKPQPDYFRGPTAQEMWSWLEVAPQHVFKNSAGEKEQMSVGVAQNAVGARLGSMSEPDARGRSFHAGAFDRKPDAVQHGYNFSEQWDRALKEDPKFVFITGWNEWIAGRFDQFGGVKAPVMFVDTFDEEHSRDIEPMKGGHGDNYYYQMVSYIRRFKGARKPPAASAPKTIRLDGGFDQWADVAPEFRDDIGDAARRDHPGYNNCARYINQTGRNDFVALKVARDGEFAYFYARTKDPIAPSAGPHWMMLFIDSDCDHNTGWEGYDFVVNRTVKDAGVSSLEAYDGAGSGSGAGGWRAKSEIKYRVHDNELMLAIRRSDLGFGAASKPMRFDFKWADNIQREGDVNEFTLNGDSAPNGRFNYRFEEK
ncbi:MAG: hypothetical protein NTX50_20365 [Candidatus Sumerlaeota bacterium]|nr:hypothetical protein [Candidatus Sumerlaeota bacterium]